jgi:uncharacterized membrane protein YkoI
MKRAFIAAVIAAGLIGPVSAWAQPGLGAPPPGQGEGRGQSEQQAAPRGQSPQQPAMSLQRIIEQIARRTPGRQLNTKREVQNGVEVYLIAWSTSDGRRIDFVVDARTGRILRQEGG